MSCVPAEIAVRNDKRTLSRFIKAKYQIFQSARTANTSIRRKTSATASRRSSSILERTMVASSSFRNGERPKTSGFVHLSGKSTRETYPIRANAHVMTPS